MTDVELRPAGRERGGWPVVLVACAAASTMFMAVTNVVAALPEIARDIDASQRQLQWVADCYPLALATLLLPAGVLADRYGRRRFLAVGVALLALGLAGASQADTPTALLASLALAGIGSGLGFPSTLATISGTTSAAQRPTAVSLWAAAVPFGGLVGAMLTGVVIELGSWRWAFGATAACAAATFVAVAAATPETRDREPTPLDVPGTLLSAAGVAAVVLGIIEAPIAGWTSPTTLGWLAAATVLLGAFVAWELRTEHPLLDVRLFAIPAFSASVGAMFVMFGALFAIVYLAYQWQYYVLGSSTLTSGLGLAPLAILMLPLAVLSTRIATRIGLRGTMTLAMLAGATGAVLYACAGRTEAYWTLGLGCLAFGGCIGLSAGPGTMAISSPLPPSRQGVASAVNDLARELGATLGIAVAGTVFNIAYRREVRTATDVVTDPTAAALLNGPGAGERAIAAAQGPGAPYREVLVSASNAGWTLGAAVVAGVLIVGALVFAAAYPRSPSDG